MHACDGVVCRPMALKQITVIIFVQGLRILGVELVGGNEGTTRLVEEGLSLLAFGFPAARCDCIPLEDLRLCVCRICFERPVGGRFGGLRMMSFEFGLG